jgi:hypothetical protein
MIFDLLGNYFDLRNQGRRLISASPVHLASILLDVALRTTKCRHALRDALNSSEHYEAGHADDNICDQYGILLHFRTWDV